MDSPENDELDTENSDEVGYKRPPKNRQFGQPEGNIPGRLKGSHSVKAALKRIMAMEDPGSFKRKTGADEAAWALYQAAIKEGGRGQVPALAQLIERMDGKEPTPLHHSSDTGMAVEVNFIKPEGKDGSPN